MPILDTTLACSLCGEDSTVREIGDHLSQVHIGPGDSDWHCSNGCLYRTANKAEMASHCLITRHPAAELTRPLTFPQMLAAVQSQFCPVIKASEDRPDNQSEEATSHCSENADASMNFDCLEHEPHDGRTGIYKPEFHPESVSLESEKVRIEVCANVQNLEPVEEEHPEMELDSPRSPEQSDEECVSEPCMPKPFQCDNCGFTTVARKNLTNHIHRKHTFELPFHCQQQQCLYSAISKTELKHHYRTHTGEKPFTCPICHNSFARAYALTEHQRRHTGERPFTCPTCKYSFAERSALKKHQRTHTEEKPYKCVTCLVRFHQKQQLMAHELTHKPNSKWPFKCADCPKTCRSKAELRDHIFRHHQAGKGLYWFPENTQNTDPIIQ